MTLTAPHHAQRGPATHPFDAVAANYDETFTDRRLGRWLREIVWERMERVFAPGQHLLELGCGTGEDAVWLASRGINVTATDASPRMLEKTRRKADAAGLGDRVTTRLLDLTVPVTGGETGYDGAYSNFGPLNCVEDRQALARDLARLIQPAGKLVVVVMGPVCPWEIAWFMARLKPKTALRRFCSGQEARVGDGTVRVWYPSHRRLQREFAPHFRTLEVVGVGLLLPPSEMGRLVDRAPGFFKRIAALDRRLAGSFLWRWLNDHYLMVLERR